MHKYLMDMLECPECHGDLKWNIKKETSNRIEEGEAICKVCGAKYPIKQDIGIFLTSQLSRNDLWEESNNQLVQYFKEHPEIKDKLMSTSIQELSPADKFFRALLLEEEGQLSEAKEIFKIAESEIYTSEYIECWNKQEEYISQKLKSSKEPIIDLASGRCYFVEKLAKQTEAFIVATDFSPRILLRNRIWLKYLGVYDKISLLAFDARMTPFKDNSIKVLTSNVGLMNIEEPKNLLKELRRVVGGKFMAINAFYPESDKINGDKIHKLGFDTFLFYSVMMDKFKEAGWEVQVVNQCSSKSSPTPTGKILEGASIDGLPVADTLLKWGVIEAK
ncbi:methyltransferase domain-containing protein [Haloimpatiens sp. FM7330]|uniref:methyltransferase domain-containing protein n=1 Tax=Haloimpatiens sp. FM7330 TaxID=3298610 RepID=UPI00362DB226